MSGSGNQKHRPDVVTTVFPSAVPLFDYCTSVIKRNHLDIALIQPSDSAAYKDLLRTSLIVPPSDAEGSQFAFKFNGRDRFPIHDIVGRLISQLVRSGQQYHEQNCLTLGYRLKSTGSDATMRSNNDTEVYFVNTVQALVSTQTWQLLANRIGEELLRHLLKQPVFVKSANLCYVQVSGTSASEMVFKASKRQKLNDGAQNSENILLKACIKKRRNDQDAMHPAPFPILSTSKDAVFRAALERERKKPISLLATSQVVPRFKIFYSAQYVKKIGLPAKHPFNKKHSSCAAQVATTFLPALSLLTTERAAVAMRDKLVALFDAIKTTYAECPLPSLMERHCSIEALSTLAEPLVKEEAEEPDASGLFMTPASKTSMQICQDLKDSEFKPTRTGPGTDTGTSTSDSTRNSAGVRSRASTWHSTASVNTSAGSVKMTLTNSTEQELTAASSDTFTGCTPTGAQTATKTVRTTPNELELTAESNRVALPSKKRKRGCRAGAMVKQRKQQADGSTPPRKETKDPQPKEKSTTRKRTIAQEIHTNIEQLWKQHAQRELVTVGEKLVNNVLQNVRCDARLQELGINTQGSVRSAQSAPSAEKKCSTSSATGEELLPPQELYPPTAQGESETTFASAPSVVHRPSTDKKRKFVSIQESPNEPEVGGSFGSSQQAQPEFEYFIASGTPSVSGRPLTAFTGERTGNRVASTQQPVSALKSSNHYNSSSESQGTGLSALNESGLSISCPPQLGSITLRDCSRAKRKKIKFKFRAFFKKKLAGGAPLTPSVGQCSPILPDSVDSGLLHHLSRPFLTEARSGEKNGRDPRAKLFPGGDSPASTRTPQRTPSKHHRLHRAARLDDLIQKSDLLSLSTPTTVVAAFVKSVCRKVFTVRNVWGTRRNLHAFLSTVDTYVRLGRQETLTLALVCGGIHLSHIPWLKSGTTGTFDAQDECTEEEAALCGASIDCMEMEIGGTQCSEGESVDCADHAQPSVHPSPASKAKPEHAPRTISSRSDSLASMQVFYRFMEWVYSDFINPLLAANFYTTEVEGRGAEVLYYRKSVWARIVQRGKQQLCNNFVPLVCSEEAHLSIPAGTSPTKAPRPQSSTGNLSEQMEKAATLQRANSAPTTHESHLPRSSTAPPLQTFHRAGSGSLLFNEVLQAKQYAVSSLAVENNELIAKLPPPRAGVTLNRTGSLQQSAKLKNFLQRLPVVRFVPKKSSVRAITNLRTKRINGTMFTTNPTFSTRNGQQIGEVLTNSALYNCLHVLKSVYTNRPALIGFGAFGLDDIYLKLLKYKQNLAERAAVAPSTSTAALDSSSTAPGGDKISPKQPFFVAVLDLEKCYDNVDPQKLYDLLKRVLSGADETVPVRTHSSPLPTSTRTQGAASMSAAKKAKETATLTAENVIHKFSVTHPIKSMDRNVTKNVRYVASGGAIVPFREASKEVAHCYPYSIVTDAVVYPKISNQEILRLLKVHLFQHAVKIPVRSEASRSDSTSEVEATHQYFTQIKGIPQGSVLSPILCTMYYGHAERAIFGTRESIEVVGLADKTLVIRLMDDYIVISTEQACVQRFLQTAHQSLKAYGAGVNPLKTRTNFDASVDVDGACIPLQRVEGEEMPWCGLIVNTRTLEVTCHFSRLLDRPISSSVLTEYARSGAALRRAIKSFMRMKCHAIVLDAQINSKRTVVQTLYTMYLIVAMRTYAYIRHLRQVLPNVRNDSNVCASIVEGVMFGARLINTRTVRKSLRKLVMGSAAHAQRYSYLTPVDANSKTAGAQRNTNSSTDASPEEEDFGLFSQCVECPDPESFGRCDVSLQEANWLGMQAFIVVLNKRRSHFGAVVRALTTRQADFAATARRRLERVKSFDALLHDCEAVLDSAQWL